MKVAGVTMLISRADLLSGFDQLPPFLGCGRDLFGQPRPQDFVLGLQELNLSSKFLPRRASQEVHERMKDLRHRVTIAKCGIFRDDEIFLPRRNLGIRRDAFPSARFPAIGSTVASSTVVNGRIHPLWIDTENKENRTDFLFAANPKAKIQ
jgi:hypothetical protein